MHAVFCPGLKKGTVLLEGKGHFSTRISFWGHFSMRNFILRAVSCSELLIEPVLTPSGWKLNYSNPCWHQVDENWTIWTRADTEWMKTELFEPVLPPSGWKLNYSNLCWHQVDENWTIRTRADTKWMKTLHTLWATYMFEILISTFDKQSQ